MPAYHQMGHDSENLLREDELSAYRGAILSPVNYRSEKVQQQIATANRTEDFRTIFDPQLYVPTSERGCLREWPYFPTDVDTADYSSEGWWNGVVDGIVATVAPLAPHALCSPTVVPRVFSNEYFSTSVYACNRLVDRLSGTAIVPILTAVVGLAELTPAGRPLEVASILSQANVDEVFLVLSGNTEPRRELRDPEELKAAMRLIRTLEDADMRVTVGFCSSDIVLWKHAGATSCATGKFFNLRRFTRTRFEEPSGGGGQLPYWFEEALLAFLRESDLIRVRRAGLLSDCSGENPFGRSILESLDLNPPTAWVAKSWRHYLWWFASMEARIGSGEVDVPRLLKQVEETWQQIEDTILMEEPTNNGSWLRAWRRAVVEFNP